ncbi:MAG: 50S ribosomal protein L25 [bacterium]|nr:50S ribosomal protein L25 [bacterium]
MLAIEVEARKAKESPEALRTRGAMPAVFYGPKEGATAVSIDAHKFEKIWREAGETTVVVLKGIGEEKEVLIHDVQFHPVTSSPLHADFYVLEKGKKIKIKVPLVFTGSAPAEKAGHILVKTLHEIEIEVAPAELPHNLPVDVSALANVGDHITAGQIVLPPSAKLITGAKDIVASISEFKEEKVVVPEPAAPAEGAVAAPAEGTAPVAGAPKPEAKAGEKKEKNT